MAGGPIKKDKIFFFGGYEGIRSTVGNAFPVQIPETAPQAVPDPVNSIADAITGLNHNNVSLSPVSLKILGCSAAGTSCTGGFLPSQPNTTNFVSSFPNNNVSDTYIVKMDYQINEKNRINGMLLTGHYNAVGEDHAAVNAAWTDNGSKIAAWSQAGRFERLIFEG